MRFATAGLSSPKSLAPEENDGPVGSPDRRECVAVLALHQPVASDLRRVAAVLKINGDLERLCDLACHIAKRIKKLTGDPDAFPIPQPLENLAIMALSQIRDGLDAPLSPTFRGGRTSSPLIIKWTLIIVRS